MASYDADLRALESDFRRRGIDTSTPGFYDHPAFVAAEQRDNTFLNRYARYVDVRQHPEDYIHRASVEIPVIAETLHGILVQDARQGACVDMSGVLSRTLDREGFWNYVVKGSLTITFPTHSGIGQRYFRTVDRGNFVAGHAWVVAPPLLGSRCHIAPTTLSRKRARSHSRPCARRRGWNASSVRGGRVQPGGTAGAWNTPVRPQAQPPDIRSKTR
jgi:hypothetical protein